VSISSLAQYRGYLVKIAQLMAAPVRAVA
jgi:hypothetical protein